MLSVKMLILLTVGAVALAAIRFGGTSPDPQDHRSSRPLPAGAKDVYVAGGCFWCLDAMFEQLRGVYSVESGYAGGSPAGVSYEDVCSGATGHAETVRIIYDPKELSEADIFQIFFTVHNPTTLNRQGPDEGTQYRSAIFYRSPEEKALAEHVRDQIGREKVWPDPIVTSIEPLKNYTPAEDYHQDYLHKFETASPLQRARMNSGYCTAVVEPHVLEFRKRFFDRLKKQ